MPGSDKNFCKYKNQINENDYRHIYAVFARPR